MEIQTITKWSLPNSRTLYLGCLHLFHLKCLSTVDTPPHFNQLKPIFFAGPNLHLSPLSLSGDDSGIHTTPPPGPSTAEAEEMWKEYAKNRSTAPEYFLFPPFTPEQEEWLVTTNHPFKEYVLQTWQSSIHSSVQGWLEDLVN